MEFFIIGDSRQRLLFETLDFLKCPGVVCARDPLDSRIGDILVAGFQEPANNGLNVFIRRGFIHLADIPFTALAHHEAFCCRNSPEFKIIKPGAGAPFDSG